MSCFVNGKMYTWKPSLPDRWMDSGFSIWHDDLSALQKHGYGLGSSKMSLVMSGDFLVCLEQHTQPTKTGLLSYVKFLTKHGRIGWCIIQPENSSDWKLVTE
jgi:hypothetical protein